MRRSFLIALAAAASLVAGQGIAQEDHTAHHPAATEPAPTKADAKPGIAMGSMKDMDPAAMHQMCMGVMGKQMANKSVHEHSREKSGIAVWPNGKPLTKAEMAKMHARCAEMMEDHHAAGAEAPAPK
jgi:predicted alpha/beta hydrolase family esterase